MHSSARISACCICLAAATLLTAGSKPSGKGAAHNAVQPIPGKVTYVLQTEQRGPVNRREELSALDQSAPALWQSGYLLQDEKWQSFDTIRPTEKRAALLAEYQRRRAALPPTGDAHFALATWCRKNELPLQEEAHLTQTFVLGSNQKADEACRRLGYQSVSGNWLTPEDRAEFGRMQKQMDQSLQKWGSRISKLATDLTMSTKKRERGLANLDSIRDPDAVGAIEWIMCGQGQPVAEVAVRLLSRIKTCEATMALARQGVFNKWPSAREAAATVLTERDPEDFVTQLLGLLATPVAIQVESRFVGRNGSLRANPFSPGVLCYNYLLAQETDDQVQVASLRTIDFRSEDGRDDLGMLRREEYRVIARPSDVRAATDTLRASRDEAYRLEKIVEQANSRTTEFNSRVITVLSKISGESYDEDVHTWWNWWDTYNERETPKKRICYYKTQRELGNPCPPPAVTSSCFVAGTLVWTEVGSRPIETLLAGDLVLSQDLDSGELGYQPILQTTLRASGPTLRLQIGEEAFRTTAGHRFWVPGSGWKMIRDVKAGALLHTATSSISVDDVKPDVPAATYNLVVARTHNYFVGKSALLTHDILLPRSTNRRVPGLVER